MGTNQTNRKRGYAVHNKQGRSVVKETEAHSEWERERERERRTQKHVPGTPLLDLDHVALPCHSHSTPSLPPGTAIEHEEGFVVDCSPHASLTMRFITGGITCECKLALLICCTDMVFNRLPFPWGCSPSYGILATVNQNIVQTEKKLQTQR